MGSHRSKSQQKANRTAKTVLLPPALEKWKTTLQKCGYYTPPKHTNKWKTGSNSTYPSQSGLGMKKTDAANFRGVLLNQGTPIKL